MAGKIITIDWELIAGLPSDEYQLKPLNKQQSAILLALCEYQHWTSRWDNLALSQHELDRFMGDIEYRLMLNQGTFLMTPEEYYDAHKRATYDAWNDIAKQIVSGRTTDIAVGSDGTVSDPTTGNVEPETPVEDDPTTVLNETLATKSGGCMYIWKTMQKVANDVAAWWTATLTQPEIEQRLVDIYGFDADPVNDYMSFYFGFAPTKGVPPTITEALAEALFGRGVSLQTINYYIYNLHGVAGDQAELLFLAKCIGNTAGILSDWFAQGSLVPSTDYIAWVYTPIAPEAFTLNMSTANLVEYTTSGFWKRGHRFKIEISGTFTDSDNPGITYDGMYKIVTATGVKTWWPIIFTGSGLPTNPDQDNIPYSAAHLYSFTQDVSTTATAGTVKIGKDNGPEFALPNTTGILTFTVTDLGYYAS